MVNLRIVLCNILLKEALAINNAQMWGLLVSMAGCRISKLFCTVQPAYKIHPWSFLIQGPFLLMPNEINFNPDFRSFHLYDQFSWYNTGELVS